MNDRVSKDDSAASAPHSTGAPRLRSDLRDHPLPEREALLQAHLRRRIAESLGIAPERVAPDTPFTGLHAAWETPSAVYFGLRRLVQEDLGFLIYPNELADRFTLRVFARYLAAEIDPPPRQEGISFTDLYAGGNWSWPLPAPLPPEAARLPGILFVLSAPRSGSTLVRTMLAGHAALFSPPELHLLPFESMGQRRRILDQNGGGWQRSGLGTALAALERLDAVQTQERLNRLEQADTPIPEVYQMLQQLAGDRLLVDKSPTYSAHPLWLRRAEELFAGARYLCLVRHPYAVIESFVRMRFHRLLDNHWLVWDENPWLLAEKVWTSYTRHILEFTAGLPSERVHWVRYEDLVSDPAAVMERVCQFLGIAFDPALLEPYQGERMTVSRRVDVADVPSLGDPNLLRYRRIEAALAEDWRQKRPPQTLSPDTRVVADRFRYELP